MSGHMFVFDEEKMQAAMLRHVNEGPPATRALRVQDCDGVRNFLFSDAAAKLRVQPPKEN